MEERFDEDSTIDEEIRGILHGVILGNVDREIRKIWLRSTVAPKAAKIQMQKLDRIIAWATLEYDGAVTTGENPLETYIPDGEPAPASIDTWARGSVPVRKAPVQEPEFESGLTSARSRTNSVSSRQSGSSRRSGTMRSSRYASSARGSSRGKDGKMEPLYDDDHPEIFMLDDDENEEELMKLDESRKMFKALQKVKMSAEISVASLESEDDEFSMLQSQVDRAAKDLKGKKYIMDKDGNPILLNPVKGDNLPPFLMPVKMSVTNVPTAEEKAAAAAAAEKAAKKKKGGNKSKEGKKIRVAGSREVEAEYFVPSTSLTTVLATTEPTINPGVTMKFGDSVREGGEVPEDSLKPTRKAYATKIANSMGNITSPSGHDIGMSLSRGGIDLEGSTETFGVGDLEGGSYELPASMSLLRNKMREPDIDPLSGSRVIESPTITRTPSKRGGKQRTGTAGAN